MKFKFFRNKYKEAYLELYEMIFERICTSFNEYLAASRDKKPEAHARYEENDSILTWALEQRVKRKL